jgi:hypothetical protein
VSRLSIEHAFVAVQQMVAREWRLLVPVALTFFTLPPLLYDLLISADEQNRVMAALRAQDLGPVSHVITGKMLPLGLLIVVCSMLGSLAITALALLPRISVGEAIARAGRRLWVELVAVLMLFGVLTLLLLLCGMAVMMSGASAAGAQSLLVGLIFGISIYAGVRLSLRHGVLITQPVGPVATIRESWVLSSGSFWRLLLALALYLVGSMVVLLALNTAIGAMLLLGARLAGSPELGIVLTQVLGRTLAGLVGGGIALLNAAFFAQLSAASRGT